MGVAWDPWQPGESSKAGPAWPSSMLFPVHSRACHGRPGRTMAPCSTCPGPRAALFTAFHASRGTGQEQQPHAARPCAPMHRPAACSACNLARAQLCRLLHQSPCSPHPNPHPHKASRCPGCKRKKILARPVLRARQPVVMAAGGPTVVGGGPVAGCWGGEGRVVVGRMHRARGGLGTRGGASGWLLAGFPPPGHAGATGLSTRHLPLQLQWWLSCCCSLPSHP